MVLTGCVQVPLSYHPAMQNLETLRASNMPAANVGKFALAPGKPPSIDQSVTARDAIVVSPHNNSFALFLREALVTELRAAGKFDPNSAIVISGLLTENAVEAPMGTGKGALGAKFSVTREGSLVYEKELNERAEWPSAFIGVDAVPTAINEYTSLYKKLLFRLFGDNDFKKATSAK